MAGKITELVRLHANIDARVQAVREGYPDWLCGKGCDNCCRRLAAIPQLTVAEWDFLREGLAAVPFDQLREIRREMSVLSGQSSAPFVCPLLERTTGACPVYAQRPVACRTYGFYVQRDLGLYCRKIEARVADGEFADVVWGNHDAIDQQLAGLGETRALNEWFEDLELSK